MALMVVKISSVQYFDETALETSWIGTMINFIENMLQVKRWIYKVAIMINTSML